MQQVFFRNFGADCEFSFTEPNFLFVTVSLVLTQTRGQHFQIHIVDIANPLLQFHKIVWILPTFRRHSGSLRTSGSYNILTSQLRGWKTYWRLKNTNCISWPSIAQAFDIL